MSSMLPDARAVINELMVPLYNAGRAGNRGCKSHGTDGTNSMHRTLKSLASLSHLIRDSSGADDAHGRDHRLAHA